MSSAHQQLELEDNGDCAGQHSLHEVDHLSNSAPPPDDSRGEAMPQHCYRRRMNTPKGTPPAADLTHNLCPLLRVPTIEAVLPAGVGPSRSQAAPPLKARAQQQGRHDHH
jgi:hypothetical protein